jgi:DNA-directed RNA polymerase subunit RPC12/RpoP
VNIKCTQCGGEIEVGERELFVTCPYCSSAIYVDPKKVVFHYVLRSTIDAEGARSNLRRWMAGNETVKGLEEKSEIAEEDFTYFPFWYFRVKKDGEEKIITRLAASTPIVDLKKISIPAGDLEFYEPSKHASESLREPETSYQAALAWLEKEGAKPEEVAETALVHVPVYNLKYRFDDETYSSVIEGSSGKVYSSVYPAKSETPFYLIAVAALLIFLIEGLLIPQMGTKLLAYAISSVPLIGASILVSERV